MVYGKIIKGIAGFYYVHVEACGIYECKAKGNFRNKKIKLSKEKYTADILTTKTKRQKKTKRGFLYKTRQIDYKRK